MHFSIGGMNLYVKETILVIGYTVCNEVSCTLVIIHYYFKKLSYHFEIPGHSFKELELNSLYFVYK